MKYLLLSVIFFVGAMLYSLNKEHDQLETGNAVLTSEKQCLEDSIHRLWVVIMAESSDYQLH